MKTLSSVLAATTLALTLGQTATAAPNPNSVYFKAPAIAGSGCPAHTTSHALTPDGQTLSILFSAYVAENRRPKSCNIAVPVHVPNGFQVSLLTADYRGFVQGRAELSRKYFFAGQYANQLKTPLSSGHGKDYLQRDNLVTMSNVFSRCGKDVNLRINSRIRPQNNHSFITVDSLDLQNGMVFHLQYRRC